MKSRATALKVRNSVILCQGSICYLVVGFFCKTFLVCLSLFDKVT